MSWSGYPIGSRILDPKLAQISAQISWGLQESFTASTVPNLEVLSKRRFQWHSEQKCHTNVDANWCKLDHQIIIRSSFESVGICSHSCRNSLQIIRQTMANIQQHHWGLGRAPLTTFRCLEGLRTAVAGDLLNPISTAAKSKCLSGLPKRCYRCKCEDGLQNSWTHPKQKQKK